MQIQGPISLVFPPAAAAPNAPGSATERESRARGEPTAAGSSAAATRASAAGQRTPAQEDAKTLSLQDQLELGKNRGLFAHITYTRAGRIGPPTSPSESAGGDAFAREAANVMREFSQDLAALKGETPAIQAQWDSAPSTSTVMAHKLKTSLQQVASKLNVFA